MKYFVAVTDNEWFRFLARLRPGEVNFWRPAGKDAFRAVGPGSPFLFKLHAPDDFIVGGGFFVKFEVLPLSLAWEAFGEKNGAPDFDTFTQLIHSHRSGRAVDPVIGCVILAEPFFFEREDWIPVPPDWRRNIVRGKTYDTQTTHGRALWREVSQRLMTLRTDLGEQLLHDAAFDANRQFGSLYLAHARLGQGAFRVLVTSAYQRKCAITGERVLPALEAAHIKPYKRSGPNRVCNGLLLRSDVHRLFDYGYLTVTPDLRVEVSRALAEEFHNGRRYRALHGRPLTHVPVAPDDRPDRKYLEWHNENVFLAS